LRTPLSTISFVRSRKARGWDATSAGIAFSVRERETKSEKERVGAVCLWYRAVRLVALGVLLCGVYACC